MSEPTLKRLNLELKRFDITPDSKAYVPALVLICSAFKGPNADRIANFIGRPRSEVRVIGNRLRDNLVWLGNKVNCDWFGKDGGVAFMCDVCVAQGLLARESK